MKKFTALAISLVLIVCMLTGCAASSLPDGINGTQASKLLLARERLNAKTLKDANNIFETGPAVFANLGKIADENLVKYSYSDEEQLNVELASFGNDVSPLFADKKVTCGDGSYFELNGNTYTWTKFAEYSNSYDYFLNITKNVKSASEMGAKLIDNIKKHVRIVDTWVSYFGQQFYLHVEENSELLISRNSKKTHYEICIRYKNSDGKNVYELYSRDIETDSNYRTVYIPGEKFYYSYSINDFDHNFSAENTKGFWEVVDIGGSAPNFQISCMVFKDDVCYDAVYGTTSQSILRMDIMSSDKQTDILSIRETHDGIDVEIQLQAFDGYKHVEITVTDDQISEDLSNTDENAVLLKYENYGKELYITSGQGSATLVLENGMRLTENDVLIEEKATVGRVMVDHFGKEQNGDGYTADVSFEIFGETFEENIGTLKQVLELTGLKCRRSLDEVISGIVQAQTELLQFTKYHKWNDSVIATPETVTVGWERNKARFKEFRDMYESVKDTEVISFNDVGSLNSNMVFPEITAQSAASAVYGKDGITVTDLELTLDDTLLLVVNEPYVINFALVDLTGGSGLVHFEVEGNGSTEYLGEDTFVIKQSSSFTLPEATKGKYALVAYVSTEDGIRSSNYTPIKFTENEDFVNSIGGLNVTSQKAEDGTLTLVYSKSSEIEVIIPPAEGGHTYATVYSALEAAAYEYGYASSDSVLEIKTDGGWSAVSESEEPLANGVYRLKFSVKNGSNIFEGYVFTSIN